MVACNSFARLAASSPWHTHAWVPSPAVLSRTMNETGPLLSIYAGIVQIAPPRLDCVTHISLLPGGTSCAFLAVLARGEGQGAAQPNTNAAPSMTRPT